MPAEKRRLLKNTFMCRDVYYWWLHTDGAAVFISTYKWIGRNPLFIKDHTILSM